MTATVLDTYKDDQDLRPFLRGYSLGKGSKKILLQAPRLSYVCEGFTVGPDLTTDFREDIVKSE